MSSHETSRAVLAATTMLAVAIGAPAASQAAQTPSYVKCAGINTCKGTSECKTASSACKGQNTCKGRGWLYTKTAQECSEKGGKVVKV